MLGRKHSNKQSESRSEPELFGVHVRYSKSTACANPKMIIREYDRLIERVEEDLHNILEPKLFIDMDDLEKLQGPGVEYESDGSRLVKITGIKLHKYASWPSRLREYDIQATSVDLATKLVERQEILNEKYEFENRVRKWINDE